MLRSLAFRRSLLHFESLEERLAPALFTVTNLSNSGAGSLRQAIVDANAASGADTIDFSPAVFATQKTITLSSGELSITGSLTITGPTAGVRISGNNASRVFDITGAASNSATFLRLAIMNGDAGSESGGGIRSQGPLLDLRDCTIADCRAKEGGAIATGLEDVFLARCGIFGNSATFGSGGGVYHGSSSSRLFVYNSTFAENFSFAYGGAIYTGGLTMHNSTLMVNYCNNIGGGIYRPNNAGLVEIESSVVADNIAPTNPDIQVIGGTVRLKTSAIGTGGFSIDDKGGNLPTGITLKLGPLADNGGLSKTRLPAFDSPLINVGSNPLGVSSDQRGTSYPRVLNGLPDIGAAETLDTVVRNTFDSGPGSLRQLVADSNGYKGADTLTFDPAAFNSVKLITLVSGQLDINESLTIVGPGANLLTINGNQASRIFQAVSVPTGTAIAISGMTIINGSAAGNGGAIRVDGVALALAGIALTANSATGNGGGLAFSAGSLSITNSAIWSNQATGDGGGAAIDNPTGTPQIQSSTISGNTAQGIGGGLALTSSTVTLTVLNSTITANASINSGGGVARTAPTGGLTLASTIVSGNTAPAGADVASPGLVAVNYCAIGSTAGFTLTGAGNLFAANLILAPLSYAGGPTPTHLPSNHSPLVDAGSNPLSLTTDQRGLARTIGANTDIGAVEARAFVVRNSTDSDGGSLRQVLASADALAGADTVMFDPAVFATPQTISIATGIGIGSAVTLIGPGAGLTTLKGVSAFPVMFTTIAPSGTPIAVSGLTLTQGALGVSVEDEALTLADCVVTGNLSLGGIAVAGGFGSLTLDRCAITNNQGGGVRLFGYVYSPAATIRDTVISGNTAAKGAGIYLQYAGNLFVERTTIAGNQATAGSGGGILSNNHNSERFINIRNSTLSGNSTSAAGGGIAIPGGTATVSFENTTITGNTATTAGGGIGLAFGAIDLTSCIVSGNVNVAAPDISSSGKVTASFSAIGSNAGFTLSGANNLAFGANLKLGPLSYNGGPTPTHALLPGSAAIDAGSNPLSLSSDQRSVGFVRSFGGKADIGSFEVQSVPAKIVSVAINDGSAQRSRVTSLLVTFDQPPQLPGSPANGFELKRQSDNAIVALNAVPTGNTVTLTFTGGAVEFGSLADGRYKLTALASQISNLDGDGNGTAGDDFVLVGDTTNKLFRLFGDSDGDGTVAANDFIQFRLALGGTSVIFDFDGDGAVAASDFIQFRLRFGGSI